MKLPEYVKDLHRQYVSQEDALRLARYAMRYEGQSPEEAARQIEMAASKRETKQTKRRKHATKLR